MLRNSTRHHIYGFSSDDGIRLLLQALDIRKGRFLAWVAGCVLRSDNVLLSRVFNPDNRMSSISQSNWLVGDEGICFVY